jgi:type III restriction enzyme
MRLKEYQQKVLGKLNDYLTHLADSKSKYDKFQAIEPEMAAHYNFPETAWEKATGKTIYHSKRNGLNEYLPDIYLKVPTGGGKTLLACHAIDSINKTYLNRQNGLVLWIVPSNQIYRQTISALKDRAHPYRQILDISSGGCTLVREKGDFFTKQDTEQCLVILLLMLPSANRINKETLKVFRDSGAYTDFFPPEDDYAAQKELLNNITNLDVFKTEAGVFDIQIKTSLGNTLRLLKPLIIMDEGHRAYGENARNTLNGFNPSFILELSATPPPNSNKLVEITGRELNDEEMIKLDIHLLNKVTDDWRDTMLASMAKRDELEKLALIYQANTDEYIRPICLIQVERTGTDPNDKNFIHAEHVKTFLVTKGNIPVEQIAIKSSHTDDIEGIDLLSKDCAIRYIITKQALQEGWDCPFASILTILTNPGSATGITQLVGRILRQPYGRKTLIKPLDECYVFTYRQNANILVKEIKAGLEEEGLGDVSGRIVSDEGGSDQQALKKQVSNYRPGFKKFEGKIYLPKFVIQEKDSYRNINFESDILRKINWEQLSVVSIAERVLAKQIQGEQEVSINLTDEGVGFAAHTVQLDGDMMTTVNEAFIAQQLNEIIPNPWIGFEKVKEAIGILLKTNSIAQIAANTVFIIEELKNILSKERDRLAEAIFKDLIEKRRLFFFLIAENGFHLLPSHIEVNKTPKLLRSNNDAIQKSLFDYVPDDDFNGLEKPVAVYLDEQEKLLWWYRNISKQHYHIQGWKKNKIYPDFIAAQKSDDDETEYSTVYVLETKGMQLAGNADTSYKENIFALCNDLAVKRKWRDVFDDFPDHDFNFQMVYGDEWQNKLNQIFA